MRIRDLPKRRPEVARPINTSAFGGTNRTGELITSWLPVIRPLLPVRGEGLISEGIQKGLSTALT
ncbi:MAG TPA: hypothetical protein VOA78_05095, partial [Candidatus Dormibacteraeota bacterium]|nr:hypothetical protein [Candidatus Dormibacteraeota bacterium]